MKITKRDIFIFILALISFLLIDIFFNLGVISTDMRNGFLDGLNGVPLKK